MSVVFKSKSPAVVTPDAVPVLSPKPKAKRRVTNVQPQAPTISLDEPGYIRACHFQALLGNLSSGAFYQRQKKGLIPPPDGRDPRPYWRTATVKAYLLVAV